MPQLSPDNMSKKMDEFEGLMAQFPQANIPLIHRFTDGLYLREMQLQAGTVVTSRIHKTEHQFILLEGSVNILDETGTVHQLTAPYIGVTSPGTRRVIVSRTPVRWVTCHATSLTDPDQIAEAITYNDNELLPPEFKQLCFQAEQAQWHSLPQHST